MYVHMYVANYATVSVSKLYILFPFLCIGCYVCLCVCSIKDNQFCMTTVDMDIQPSCHYIFCLKSVGVVRDGVSRKRSRVYEWSGAICFIYFSSQQKNLNIDLT